MDDTFLARWLAGELSDAEKQDFDKNTDFLLMKKIAENAEKFEFTDFSAQNSLAEFRLLLLQNYGNENPKIVPIRANWARRLAVAAATLGVILLGFYQFYNPATHFIAKSGGNHPSFLLPDSSRVTLNSGSSLDFYPRKWGSKRSVELVGEAYFEVQKGSNFEVKTAKGVVEVLGTRFNVAAWHGLEVACFSGKVRVTPIGIVGDFAPLTAGQRIQFVDNRGLPLELISETEPSWKTGISHFSNATLPEILAEMERQFGVSVSLKNPDFNEKRFVLDIFQQDFAASRQVVERLTGVNFSEESTGKWLVK